MSAPVPYPFTLVDALENERCNGCHRPRKDCWMPVCHGMTQGDYTHFHSREWWIARAHLMQAEPSRLEDTQTHGGSDQSGA